MANEDVLFSPKAKVRGSNPLGRANEIRDLARSSQSARRAKLTINSPTKRQCWRAIGGDTATAERCTGCIAE
jgi:hypothetical protein